MHESGCQNSKTIEKRKINSFIMFKISKEERKLQFVYLLLLWSVFALVFCFVCFFNYPKSEIRSKEIVLETIDKENAVLKSQLEYERHVDSLSNMVIQFDPGTAMVSLESKIEFELEELKKVQEAKKADPNYKVFRQLYQINNMQYLDKKAIWNRRDNINSLTKDLDDCKIGFEKNKEKLNIREALSGAGKN